MRQTTRASAINYDLVAVRLGDAVKYDLAVNEIERIAQAVLRVQKYGHPHGNITSIRAQVVYDYVLSLRESRLSEGVKRARLVDFVLQLLPDDTHPRAGLLRLCGEERLKLTKAPDFTLLMNDDAVAQVLSKRWTETSLCLESGAFLAAIVTMGSILEGVLLAIITAHPKAANTARSSPKAHGTSKVRHFGDWSLSEMINVAHECGWLQRDIKDFSHELRDYRNLVHPWYQQAKGFDPDEGTCSICWEIVVAAIDDLMQALEREA